MNPWFKVTEDCSDPSADTATAPRDAGGCIASMPRSRSSPGGTS